MVAGRQHLGWAQQFAKNGWISLISAGRKMYILSENSLYRIDPGNILVKV
jgi:hypothetical protein